MLPVAVLSQPSNIRGHDFASRMEPLYLNLDGSVLLHSLRLWHVALDVYISYIYIKFIDCYVYTVIGGVNCGVLTLVSEIRRYRSDFCYYYCYVCCGLYLGIC